MSINNWFLGIGALLFISLFFIKKERKLYKVVLILAIVTSLGGPFLPLQLFGKWNAIKSLNGRPISRIVLSPSAPDWRVNLTDSLVTIANKNEVANIVKLLQETEAYVPSHPMRIWETQMVLVTTDNDSLALEIHKTTDDGTVVYATGKELRKDELSVYLEKITGFIKPTKSTIKN